MYNVNALDWGELAILANIRISWICMLGRSTSAMDKLQLKGQNLGRLFNFRCDHVHDVHFLCYRVKLPNLKLKTWPKHLLGLLPLDIVLPASAYLAFLPLMKKSFITFSIGCEKNFWKTKHWSSGGSPQGEERAVDKHLQL
jgi:hypothetical protein